MAKKDARIFVHAARKNGKIDFWLESNYKKPGGLTFHSPKKEVFDAIFIIADNEFGLTFRPDPKDAFWISKQACPKSPSYVDDFEALRVSHGGDRLVVENRNREKCDYYFSLNFDSYADGPLQYDPIIINQNGGDDVISPVSWGSAIVASAAALIGVLAVWKYFDRKEDR